MSLLFATPVVNTIDYQITTESGKEGADYMASICPETTELTPYIVELQIQDNRQRRSGEG